MYQEIKLRVVEFCLFGHKFCKQNLSLFHVKMKMTIRKKFQQTLTDCSKKIKFKKANEIIIINLYVSLEIPFVIIIIFQNFQSYKKGKTALEF